MRREPRGERLLRTREQRGLDLGVVVRARSLLHARHERRRRRARVGLDDVLGQHDEVDRARRDVGHVAFVFELRALRLARLALRLAPLDPLLLAFAPPPAQVVLEARRAAPTPMRGVTMSSPKSSSSRPTRWPSLAGRPCRACEAPGPKCPCSPSAPRLDLRGLSPRSSPLRIAEFTNGRHDAAELLEQRQRLARARVKCRRFPDDDARIAVGSGTSRSRSRPAAQFGSSSQSHPRCS